MLLAGEGEGICSGVSEGVKDCWGEIVGEVDSSDIEGGTGVGDSCAKTAQARNSARIAKLLILVMSSGVETSLIT
jgi:hypothetical protein